MKTDKIDKNQPKVQDKPDKNRVKTVTPANDNGQAGPATKANGKPTNAGK